MDSRTSGLQEPLVSRSLLAVTRSLSIPQTGSPAAATAPQTPPCTRSLSCVRPATSALGTTSTAKPQPASRRRRSSERAIAREAFRYLTTAVANHFGVWPAVISCIERGEHTTGWHPARADLSTAATTYVRPGAVVPIQRRLPPPPRPCSAPSRSALQEPALT